MKRWLIILLLLIPSVAMASSSRIIPDSYTEYTYDSAGGGEDYTSLATWEADTDIDVTATGQVLTCSSGVHADTVTLAGATTDSNGFRVIRAAEGQRGTPTSGVRFEVSSSSAGVNIFTLSEDYATLHDIAAKGVCTWNNSGAHVQVFAINYEEGQTLVGCTQYNSTATANIAGFVRAFRTYDANNTKFINCISIGATGGSKNAWTAGFLFMNGSVVGTVTSHMYNCTSVGSSIYGVLFYRAAEENAQTVHTKNNISQGNITAAAFADFNANKTTNTQTTNATLGVTFAADGYHLASNATVAIGNGTDLSADGVFAFTDDIDGETRDDWDIGADEYVASSTRRRVIIVGD